jgi:integrase
MTLDGKRKTVQLILTPLRNTLEQALVDELIETDPFDSIRLNKILARDQMQSSFRADPFDINESRRSWMPANASRNETCSGLPSALACGRRNTSRRNGLT